MAAVPEPVAEMVRREIEAPGSLDDVLGRVEETYPELAPVLRFLSLKDGQHRHSYYVKVEHVFFRRLGWRLMRPLFALSLGAAVVSMLQNQVDPTLAIGLFLAGAASFYVVLQVFLHRWAWKDMRKLSAIDDDYRSKLAALLDGAE